MACAPANTLRAGECNILLTVSVTTTLCSGIKNLVHPPSNEKFNDVYIVTDLMETDLVHTRKGLQNIALIVLLLIFCSNNNNRTAKPDQPMQHRVIYSRQILSDEHIKFFVYQVS